MMTKDLFKMTDEEKIQEIVKLRSDIAVLEMRINRYKSIGHVVQMAFDSMDPPELGVVKIPDMENNDDEN